jgi:uncharacterized protein YndB with AHSA1/START domain
MLRVMGDRIEQHVDLDTDAEEAWRAISDRDELAAWFGGAVDVEIRPGEAGTIVDDDGVRHEVLITDVEEGRRVAWHWWDERGELSSVEITVEQTGGMTRDPRVAKHLTVLVDAGLLTAERSGRETRYAVVPGSLRPAGDWIAATDTAWSRRLGRLQQRLTR